MSTIPTAAVQNAAEELRVAKDALHNSEERLRAIFDQAAVGICICGPRGEFLEVNRKFARIVGYTAEQLRALTFHAITHPDDRAHTEERLAELRAGRVDDVAIEKRYLAPDGRVVWSLTSVTLLREPSGDAGRLLAVVEDITMRKSTEEALAEESGTLELLNRTGITLASNLNLEELVQAITDSATVMSGARFGAFFDDVASFGAAFHRDRIIRCPDVLDDPRCARWDHKGTPWEHLVVRSYLAAPVVSRSGAVIGGLFFGHPETGVFSDRSERLVAGVAAQAGVAIDNARLYATAQKASEERRILLESERAARAVAERASGMKDEFLATLSHELRTPLSAILGWSHLLRTRPASEADLARGLETIERNARVQTQLIEDLLDMSRITSGKLRLDVQPVMPVTFIEAALETVRPAAEARGIRLEKVLDPSAGPVSGDPGRLQQVTWNLLNNAIKFTPRDGKVRVVLERVSSHVELTIADSGIGIEREFVAHVFERFRQADASHTRQFQGLGLGLAIVKQLIELHGGTVRAFSEGKGTGATFTVHLPIAAGHSSRGAEPRGNPGAAPVLAKELRTVDLTGVRVLVVDDQPDARELVSRVLSQCNATVAVAGSAAEALLLVESERPDVLVSDIGMPDVDGYELLRRIRELGPERGGAVPAIALTAFARPEDRSLALHRGFQVHASKPVEPAELIATVASVAGRTGNP